MKNIIFLFIFILIPCFIVNGEELKLKADNNFTKIDITQQITIDDTLINISSKGKQLTFDYSFASCNDIIIHETNKGGLKKGTKLSFYVPDMPFSNYFFCDVTKGDIKVESTNKNGVIELEVKEASNISSSIKLSNLEVKTGGEVEHVPFQFYSTPLMVTIFDDVLGKKEFIANENYILREQHADIDYFPFYDKKVIVPSEKDSIIINNNTYLLDAKTYIKDGYIMIPVESFFYSLITASQEYNIPDKDEVFYWNTDHTSLTIKMGLYYAEFTNEVPTVNIGLGAAFHEISTSPEIKNGIMFVPFRDVMISFLADESKMKWDDKRNIAIYN